jgi:hypothetical protein
MPCGASAGDTAVVDVIPVDELPQPLCRAVAATKAATAAPLANRFIPVPGSPLNVPPRLGASMLLPNFGAIAPSPLWVSRRRRIAEALGLCW